MSRKLILSVALVIATVVIVFPSHVEAAAPVSKKVTQKELVHLLNSHRKGANLKPVVLNKKLTKAAIAKAVDMLDKAYFSHVTPRGKAPWEWITAQGYKYLYAGENLALGFTKSVDVDASWMNSKSHKENMLNGKYTEVGIAVVTGRMKGKMTTVVVEMFGTPHPNTTIASNK